MKLKLVLGLLCYFMAIINTCANEQLSSTGLKSGIATDFYQLPTMQAQILPQSDVLALPITVWQALPDEQAQLFAGKNWLQAKVVNLTENSQSYTFLIDDALHLLNGKFFINHRNQMLEQITVKKHPNNALTGQFLLKSGEQVNVYFMVRSKGKAITPLVVLNTNQLVGNHSMDYLVSGIAIGSIAMLALILFVIFLANGSIIALLLCGYFTMQAMLLSVYYGFNTYSLFPNLVELQAIELPLLVAFSSIFILWFSSTLFKLKYTHPRYHLVFKLLSWLILIYLPMSMFLSLNVNIVFSGVITLVTNLSLIALGCLLIKDDQRLATLFTAIFIIQLSFFGVNTVFYGWQQFNAPLLTSAYWLNSFLICFLLGRRYTHDIEEKRIAQQEALENEMISRNAQEELLALQNENQEQLEIRVQERTLELNIALQELEEANRELEQKNTLDELTGLYNRRFYDQKIMAEFRRSRRNLTPLSLVIIDIDHFKQVNDNYGHLVGDKCLILLATKIKQSLGRSTDVGCRYGGEEFCLILPETDSNGALALAEEIRSLVAAQEFIIDDQTLILTISCGISTYQQEKETTPELLFSAADKALYQAKHKGRNRVIIENIAESTPEQQSL